MAKIVYNDCYGGFSLSMEAAELYERLGGTAEVRRWTLRGNTYASIDSSISRTDPVLVQVVETLGERANNRTSNLQIVEVPDGTLYRIMEYDGSEWIETPADIEWKVA